MELTQDLNKRKAEIKNVMEGENYITNINSKPEIRGLHSVNFHRDKKKVMMISYLY